LVWLSARGSGGQFSNKSTGQLIESNHLSNHDVKPLHHHHALMVNFQKSQLVNHGVNSMFHAPQAKTEIHPLTLFRTCNKPPGTTFVSQTLS